MLVLLLPTCGSPAAAGSPPVIDSVTFAPASPGPTDVLASTVLAHDPDGGVVLLAYQWSRNGMPIPDARESTLDLSAASVVAGDSMSLTVTATNAELSAVVTASVVVADTPANEASAAVYASGSPDQAEDPDSDDGDDAALSVTVSLDTVAPAPASLLLASAASYGSGAQGPVTYVYTWRVNGVVKRTVTTPAPTDSLDLSVRGNADRGDAISVTVVASDGTLTSPPAAASATVAN
jgi:hypothetical protein